MSRDRVRFEVLVFKRSGWYKIALFDFSTPEKIRQVLELLNKSCDWPVVDIDKILENWGMEETTNV